MPAPNAGGTGTAPGTGRVGSVPAVTTATHSAGVPPDADTRALLTPGFLDYAVHVSPAHRYIYVVNPKVGCSSILWTLQRLESGDPDRQPARVGTIHAREQSPLQRPSQLGAAAEILRDGRYFIFTFVRNPFDRLLSCYLQKIVRPTAQRRVALGLLGRAADDDRTITLAEFIHAIAAQSPAQMDPHWRPQWTQTLQAWARYDAVGRFERFDADLLRIGTRLTPAFGRFVYSERRQATGAKPFAWITPDLAELVRDVYARDFDAFGYAPDVPAAVQP